MAQVSSSNPNANTLPGIVFDQPEVYESEPAPSEDTGINDLDLINESPDDAIALIEVPIRQAFSYFAERENDIAKFYVQRHGEYKIAGDKPEEETDMEKYHRLVSEVNELLNKFQAEKVSKLDKSELSAAGSLTNTALTNNLAILTKQLKTLEFAAEDGSLDTTQSEFKNIKTKLDKLNEKVLDEPDVDVKSKSTSGFGSDETSRLIRMSALERRLNLLETLLGHNEAKMQTLLKTTKCESLIEVSETMSSWLSLFKPESVPRINKELDYLSQRMEKINESASSSEENKLDGQTKAKLDQLCSLVTSTDKYRAMVPTIIHRLNAMEELQQRASQVTATVNHLEQIQSQIVDSLHSNKEDLTSMNQMFAKNIELIKGFSKDIDSRILAIRERDQ